MAERDVSGTEPDRKVRPGSTGVDVDNDPLGMADGALVASQNFLRLNDAGGLRKRGGLNLFVDLGADAIVAMLNVALANPPMLNPDTGVPTSEGTAMYARAYKSANVAITNNTLTTVAFDLEDFDVGGLHDLAVNNSRFTVPADGAGLWMFVAQVSWNGRAAVGGRAGAYIYKNNLTRVGIAEETPDAATGDGNLGTSFSVLAVATAIVGDYFEMKVQQNSGGALNLLGIASDLTSMAAFRLRTV